MSFVLGAGNTAFGRLEGEDTLTLMATAALAALADAGLARDDIDGVLCGYSTTMPHLMLSTVFCEYVGLRPSYAHAASLGGATGCALLALADALVRAGTCRTILVVAGENRLSGQARDAAVQTLAQVGHPVYEVPLGATVPAYYSLLASRYLSETDASEHDLAELAVLMRVHAARHPDAHLRAPITVDEVLASKPIAAPLKLLDCCPISDGACALVVGAAPGASPVRIAGTGQAHLHQHVSAMDFGATGARLAADRAFARSDLGRADVDLLMIYDSFTVTLAWLLEETGWAGRGEAGPAARAGRFGRDGPLPLNPHGGLLSFGHSGVAGGMAHAVEAVRQLAGQAGDRQVRTPTAAFVHADGGVLSSHVSLILSTAPA